SYLRYIRVLPIGLSFRWRMSHLPLCFFNTLQRSRRLKPTDTPQFVTADYPQRLLQFFEPLGDTVFFDGRDAIPMDFGFQRSVLRVLDRLIDFSSFIVPGLEEYQV